MAKSLPENLKMVDNDGNVLSNPFSGAMSALIKQAKVPDYNNTETGVSKTKQEIVKDFFMMHLQSTGENPSELPDGMETYKKVFDKIGEIVGEHLKAETKEKEDGKAAKEAKAQQKLADKEAKEAEEKQMLKAQAVFQASLEAKFPDTTDYSNKLVAGALKGIKLPENVTFSGNQMGLVFGEGVTKEQLGETAASLISAMEGKQALEGALQFTMGDLVNQSVKAKLFRTKNEANGSIKFIIEEKLKRKYSAGTLSYYALMSERIPVEKRKLGVAPSLYLTASKAVLPRLKDVDSNTQDADAKEFEVLRGELVEGINSGNLNDIKAVQEKINSFKASKGIVKESPGEKNEKIKKLLYNLFYSTWMKKYLVDPKTESVTVKLKEKGVYAPISLSSLTDIEEEAMNELQNLLIAEADTVIAGQKTMYEGTKDEEVVKVFMLYPFEDEIQSVKDAKEAKQAEIAKAKEDAEKAKADKEAAAAATKK